MRRGEYDFMLRVFICGEKYLLFELSEFLWIDVVGVKKEVTQRSKPHGQSGLGERQRCFVGAYEIKVKAFELKMKEFGIFNGRCISGSLTCLVLSRRQGTETRFRVPGWGHGENLVVHVEAV